MDTHSDLDVAVQEAEPLPDPSSGLLELRVLSGLQAGAALPLDPPLLVGRAEDCDLLLLDDHAPPHLLEISVQADGALQLTAMHDGLLLEDGTPLVGAVRVAPGQAFGIERLWLEVQHSDAPWATWVDPSERVHAATEDLAAGDRTVETGKGEGLAATDEPRSPGSPTALRRGGDPAVDFDDWILSADGENSPWQADPAQRRTGNPTGASASAVVRWIQRWKTWCVMGGGAVITVGGLLGIALQSGLLPAQLSTVFGSTSGPTSGLTSRTGDVAPAVAANGDLSSREGAALGANRESTAPGAHAPGLTVPPSAEAGGGAQAANAEDLGHSHPSGAPLADHAPILLPGRIDRVRTGGGVTVLRGDTDIVLPFEVREVVLGARSRVVLSSGQVLLPGDAVGRWRLMEVKAGTLVFDGPQRVLLPW